MILIVNVVPMHYYIADLHALLYAEDILDVDETMLNLQRLINLLTTLS